ncbi:MAG: terminase [Podoviridae sp. ctDWo9]|nr:MAG: terminase [Podoviridae sp. ctDWo9]
MELGDLLNEKEWRKCAGDGDDTQALLDGFSYFCETYWHIRHPERGRIKFVLRDAQMETARAWMEHRYTIVLKARQIGFSTLAAAFVFWEAFFWKDRFIVMLSRTEREASKLLQKTKYGYKMLPQWMRHRGPDVLVDNQLKMVFSNESSIESLPSGNDPARGEAVYRVVIDEMAFLPNPDEAWASIEPIADVGGRVICLSTANGEGNIFHTLWVGSQTRTNRFIGIFFPWSAGDRDDAWYEAKKRDLPDWQLAQEYPSDPDEAFVRSGRPVFDLDVVRSFEVVEPYRGYLHKLAGRGMYEFREDGGEFSVWEFPEVGEVYVVGADVAEGLGHGDYSSAHVVNASTGAVVAHWHGRIDADLFGEEVLYSIGYWYNTALVGVESNNHGLTTLKGLHRRSYKNLFRQRRLGQRNPTVSETLGWRTTSVSKPLAIDELAGAMRDGSTFLLCAETMAELRTFVREETGRMHGSPHDDRVMSLAIANQMLKYVWLPEYRTNDTPKPNTFRWWESMIISNSGPKKQPIGAHNVRQGADSPHGVASRAL